MPSTEEGLKQGDKYRSRQRKYSVKLTELAFHNPEKNSHLFSLKIKSFSYYVPYGKTSVRFFQCERLACTCLLEMAFLKLSDFLFIRDYERYRKQSRSNYSNGSVFLSLLKTLSLLRVC